MNKKVTITTTTINLPHIVKDYCLDIKKYGHAANIVITGDKKSPPESKEFCKKMQDETGVSINYMDVEDQNTFMAQFPELDTFLPWNCIQRRNVAILKAYLDGAESIILIDDDNCIAQEDYISGHGSLGEVRKFNAISTQSKWLNICSFLQDKNGREFYPRGYPWNERITKNTEYVETKKEGKIVVNGGFWLGDPDIDAVTRLSAPIDVIGYERGDNFCLDLGVYSPFNSQNTAIHRDIIPAYFLVPDIGRFDDIWSSYIIERIAEHLGDYISFGQPLVKQDRNEHDLWVDAYLEEMGTRLTERFTTWLRSIDLIGNDYRDTAEDLLDKLKLKIDTEALTFSERAYLNQFIDAHKVWFKTMSRIL